MFDYSNAKLEASAQNSDAAGITGPAIEAGQNEVKVEVTLTYKIK